MVETLINGGVRAREVSTCYLCHSQGVVLYRGLSDQLFGAPGQWGYHQCPRCGLIWLNSRPELGDIGGLYGRYYTHSVQQGNRTSSWLRRAIGDTILTEYGYGTATCGRRLLGWVFARLRPLASMSIMRTMHLDGDRKGRLLDVGCVNGHFLAMMRDLGWEVLGIEPDTEAAQAAREYNGVPVVATTLQSADLPSDCFDAITMHHVIEHMADPIGALQACRRSLRPGGTIAIATPNGRGLGHRILGRWWRELDPPRHLFVFSPATLLACATRAGFDRGITHEVGRRASDIWITSHEMACSADRVVGPLPRVSASLRVEGLLSRTVEEMALMVCDGQGEEVLLVSRRAS